MNEKRKRFAPLATRPNLNPKLFDPNQQTFVPDNSLDSSKIHELSVRRIQMIGVKVYSSVTQTIASNTNYHDLTPDTKTFDQGNLWRVADPTKLTIPYAGVWTVSAFGSFAASATGNRKIQLLLNASTTMMRFGTDGVNGIQTDLFITSDFRLSAGDVVTSQISQDSGGPLDVQAGEDDNFFSAVFRGPV